MDILITCKRWSVPDYRNGETEEDSKFMMLELMSDTIHTRRCTVGLETEDVITWLKIVQNVVSASIKAEEERLNKRS